MVMIPGKKPTVNKLARKLVCLLTFVMKGQSFVFFEKRDRYKAS